MIAIKTEKLRKVFGKVVAVDCVDLDVKEGELFALLGVNGAGKTTMIKMLSCLIAPTEGKVEIFGMKVGEETQKIKPLLSASPQEVAVAPNLTVEENLKFISEVYGFGKEKARVKTEELIEKLALQEVRFRFAKTLSGGYARRLSIAMALITEPKLLFLDEPTLGLDVIARRGLWEIIKELKGRITILLTTHYLDEAEALSDRIGIMKNGILKAVGTAKELKKISGKNNIEDAFIEITSPEFCAKKGTSFIKEGE